MSHACTASCTAGWGPSEKCHCSSCGLNFTTIRNFDSHRKAVSRDGDKICVDPKTVGLVQNLRGDYSLPGVVTLRDDESG